MSSLPNPAAPPARTYCNPLIDLDFPDPAVFLAEDGLFYVYATQSHHPVVNLQVARSADLVSWETLDDAMPVKPDWASATQQFWAPSPIFADGRYFLYYSAKPDAALTNRSIGLALGVATSDRPEGPFVDSGRPLQGGQKFINIDPFPFDDPATGKRLLYWGSGFHPIKVQELAEDRISFAPGSTPVDLIEPDRTTDSADYQRLIEGAWVTLRDGFYYLFYSGDNCCGKRAHYAVMVARSASATGPFEVASEPFHHVVVANQRWNAPGHNSVIRDAAGDDWIVYHAVDRTRSRRAPRAAINSRRMMVMDRIVWRDGWPTVANGGPSSTDQPAPVTS